MPARGQSNDEPVRVIRLLGRTGSAALQATAALMMAACSAFPAWGQKAPPPTSAASTVAPATVQGTAPAAQGVTGAKLPAAAPKTADGGPAAKPAKRKVAPVYHLIGFALGGTDRVDTDAIVAKLPQHKGDVITQAEIQENADRIGAALTAAHVHGDMTTATLEREGKGHYIMVVYEVHPQDALTFAKFDPQRFFGSQTFSGNTKLTAAQLAAATGLKSGQKMPDGSIGDARTGIEQAYDKVLPGKTVDVKGKVKLKKDHSVLINWQITEPK